MKLPIDKMKLFILKNFPGLARHRFTVLKSLKKSFYFLRLLPGSSLNYGPPRGIYSSTKEYNFRNAENKIEEIIIKKQSQTERTQPVTNSTLVQEKFANFLKPKFIEKKGFNLQNARYLFGDGGTVITADDKIFLPCSPLKNEWDYKLHQSLYKVKLPQAIQLDKVILIDTRCSNTNYCHWLRDHMTRFYWLSKMNLTLSDYTLVTSFGNLPFFDFSIQQLTKSNFVFKDVRTTAELPHFSANEIVIPPYSTNDLNGDSVAFEEQLNVFLKNLFLPLKVTAHYEKIYLSRKRSIRSSPEEAVLVKELISLGFSELLLEDFTVSEQASIFNNAKVVIGFHGAGFTNLFFCKTHTTIVEIFGANFIVTDYWGIANQLNLNYLAYCEDQFQEGEKAYTLARLAPTHLNVTSFLRFLKEKEVI